MRISLFVLSTTAEYALRIMIHLTEADGEPVTREAIAEATKVPSDYAVKVLQQLGRAKLVRGRRGRQGGFRLTCDPGRTTLLDVVDVIDPLERITTCPLGRQAHRRKLCPLHHHLDDVIALLQESLGEMTLQSVVEGSPGPALCRSPVDLTLSAAATKAKAKAKGKRAKPARTTRSATRSRRRVR